MTDQWITKSLGEIVEFQRGLTYSKADEVNSSSNIVLRANNIDLASNLLDLTELRHITDRIKVPVSKKLKRGSLLICTASGSKSHLGKVALVDDDYDYAFGGFMGQLTAKPAVDSKYLFYFMISDAYRDHIRALSDGVNINNLRFDDLKSLEVPVPPHPEQWRIVAILDEAFAGLATATANAEKNLKNARELFESHLNGIMTPKDVWRTSTLENLVSKTQIGLVKNLKEQGDSKPFSYVKMHNITAVNRFDSSVIARVSATPKEVETFSLKRNDFLFNTRNSRELVGKSCIYGANENGPTLFNNNIMRMQFNNVLDARFCAYAFCIDAVRSQLEAIKSGTTNVAAIYWNKLKDVVLRYPEISVQRQAVDELHSLSLEVEKLREHYEYKVTKLAELKQSILQKAFSGELTSPPAQAIKEAAE